MSHNPPEITDSLSAVCLCAEWCSTCRDWRAVIMQVAREFEGVRWRWLDIEDEADLLDELDIDIETFPTMLLARGEQVLFFGPIPAQAEVLARLVGSLQGGSGSAPGLTEQGAALWQRLRDSVE
ncbi:MAG TPA: thioredoxin family protein [Hydrogenophaga sp.]|nr:thioredoxin family protein [Hydrogenophaga sp.]